MAVEAINSGFYGKWAIFPLLESILLLIKPMLGRPFCELMYSTRLYVWLILAMTVMQRDPLNFACMYSPSSFSRLANSAHADNTQILILQLYQRIQCIRHFQRPAGFKFVPFCVDLYDIHANDDLPFQTIGDFEIFEVPMASLRFSVLAYV